MFIVIEGIDGAGKGRQRKQLLDHLESKSLSYDTTDFPDHQGVLYEHIIHPALHSEISLNPEAMFVSFALDQMLWQEPISKHIGVKDSHFVADGYFTTNIAYQCMLLKTVPLGNALDFATKFNLAQPDVVVFLDVDPEIAMQRKADEEGHDEGPDMFEADIAKQKKIRDAFLQLAKDNTFGKWSVVDGNGTIDEVFTNILTALKSHDITF